MTDIEIERLSPAIARLVLNRPERLNAISFELVTQLHDAFDELAADTELKVVIFTGAGRAFCAGLDLKNFGTPPEAGQHPHMPAGVDAQTFMSNLTVRLRDLPQVVIAAVNGPAFGGGLALACAADIRIASQSARFCSAFIRTGLSGTDIGITYLLPRLIGNANAFDLILTGRDIEATEALRMGLISNVVADEELAATALSYAEQMSAYTASGLRTTKEVLWLNTEVSSLETAIALEARNQNLLNYAPDVREYMKKYRERTTGSGNS